MASLNGQPAAPPIQAPERFALLRLSLTPGLGPVLTRRLVEHFGGAWRACEASAKDFEDVRGIGAERARRIAQGLGASERLAHEEEALAATLGARIVTRLDADYPPLLCPLEDAPAVLYVRGALDPERDRFAAGLVGSRECTPYGIEQAEWFAFALAQAGLTVVSGGARGIDSAAHRGALRAGGRTAVVLGCGLSHCYPPENADLFKRIVEAGGALVSELPLRTAPAPDNFPARNRIISGMALGVLVIEAGRRSGALITAQVASERHGREVMCVPGRVDSPSSEGANELIRSGAGAMVSSPADVLAILEGPARHAHGGTHATITARTSTYAQPEPPTVELQSLNLTTSQRTLLEALESPATLDELARATGLDASILRADATLLELRKLIVRRGQAIART